MSALLDEGLGIYAVDSTYQRPLLDAIHIVVDDGRAALIDSGTRHSVPAVLAALQTLGLEARAVDWICLTHVHLDHAGGAGALAAVLPHASIAVHPRGARHLADPTKLWQGTVAVYGQHQAERLYGSLVPVPAARIEEVGEGAQIAVGRRLLAVLDTPGHARHHVCYHEAAQRIAFTGDSFGLCYREMRSASGRSHVFATTTPVHFDPQAFKQTVARLVGLGLDAIYPTHYSRATEIPRLGASLARLIDAHVEACQDLDPGAPDAHASLVQRLQTLALQEAASQGWGAQGSAALALLAGDLDLNAQGLLVWRAAQHERGHSGV